MKTLTKKAIYFLNQKYQYKRSKNKSFSIRAFAKHLKVSPTTLSEGLRGNRSFSDELLMKIADKLQLSPLETAGLLLNSDSVYESLESDSSSLEECASTAFTKIKLTPEKLRELLVRVHSLRLEAESLSSKGKDASGAELYVLNVSLLPASEDKDATQ